VSYETDRYCRTGLGRRSRRKFAGASSSEIEIREVWSAIDHVAWLADTAVTTPCHMMGKFGSRGAVVAEAGGRRLIHVPSIEAKVLDTTGAGDAFCGGFLAGLAAGQDLAHAAARGTVSATYVFEEIGALATERLLVPTGTDSSLRCSRASPSNGDRGMTSQRHRNGSNALQRIFGRPCPLIGNVHVAPLPAPRCAARQGCHDGRDHGACRSRCHGIP
jgi:hypothetical protein